MKAPVVTEDGGSVGIGNNSIEVIDLCGKLGLSSESDPAASPSSLLDSLIQNCSRLKVPSLDTSVPSPDQQAKLVVSRFMAGGAARREVVLTTFAQDGRPSLLAASRTHLALADPWRSILHVYFLPIVSPASPRQRSACLSFLSAFSPAVSSWRRPGGSTVWPLKLSEERAARRARPPPGSYSTSLSKSLEPVRRLGCRRARPQGALHVDRGRPGQKLPPQ